MIPKRRLDFVSTCPKSPFSSVAECYKASPIDDLLLVDGVNGDNEPTVRHVNDVFLLFNQQRLAALGTDTVNKWLESLVPKNDALSELRAKCTDEQLLSLVKSKYIQSASELEAWSTYLNTHFETELAAIGALNAANEIEDETEKVSDEVASSDAKSE